MKRLADLLLNRPVEAFIRERRVDGASFRTISRELYLATNGEVDVSDVTLRAWSHNAATDTTGADQQASAAS